MERRKFIANCFSIMGAITLPSWFTAKAPAPSIDTLFDPASNKYSIRFSWSGAYNAGAPVASGMYSVGYTFNIPFKLVKITRIVSVVRKATTVTGTFDYLKHQVDIDLNNGSPGAIPVDDIFIGNPGTTVGIAGSATPTNNHILLPFSNWNAPLVYGENDLPKYLMSSQIISPLITWVDPVAVLNEALTQTIDIELQILNK